MNEKQPFKWIALNAAYTFIVLAISFLISMLARTVCNLPLAIDEVAAKGGDYSRNYYLVFPIHGLVSAIVFIASAYFISKKFGFSTGFKYRTSISTPAFVVQGIIAILFYIFLFVYMFEMWFSLPTWYLSGFLAAVFGIFDPSNVNEYAAKLGGAAEPENLYLLYFWLHIIVEAIFLVGVTVVMRYGRKAGEAQAEKEHQAQLAELQQEKERIANKKSL